MDGETREGVLTIIQRSHPYTYFGRRPIEIAEGAELHNGMLAGVVLEHAGVLTVPTVIRRAFSPRARMVDHRRVSGFATRGDVRVRSKDGAPVPVQVDGDFIGETDEARFAVRPRALSVVS
jgi:diacylglycerol kinase family enzyme